jgi:hypothetical protein
MTTLTLRRIKDHFVVTGPDIEPMKFKSRPEARDWCMAHHPGSPVREIGPKGRAPSKSQGMTLSPDDPMTKAGPKGRPRRAE